MYFHVFQPMETGRIGLTGLSVQSHATTVQRRGIELVQIQNLQTAETSVLVPTSR